MRQRKKAKTKKTVIVELDTENDAWLRTGKKARRQLTRAEFLRLVERGGVVVIRV